MLKNLFLPSSRCFLKSHNNFCSISNSVKPPPPDLHKPLHDKFNNSTIQIDIDARAPEPIISTLDNGIRVVSLDWHTLGGIGLALNTGSRYETEGEDGVAMFCEKMGFKSSAKYSQSHILTQCESKGVNINSSHTRDQILYQIEGLREDLPITFEYLSDSIINPKFLPQEFEEQRSVIGFSAAHMMNNPEIWPFETAYEVAFGDNTPLGRSIYDLNAIGSVQIDTVKNFMKKWYTPSRFVVGGLGIEHNRLEELVHKLYGHLKPDNLPVSKDACVTKSYYPDPPSSEYKGGLKKIVDDRASKIGIELPGNFQCFSACLVGFKAPSLLSGRDYYITSILSSILGTGSSFSSGGPGKGMYSRVYKEILSMPFVNSGHQVYNPLQNEGIFGLLLTGKSKYLLNMLELNIVGLLRLQDITDEEFERAKNQLMALVCTNLESTAPTLDDIIRQVSFYNNRYSYDHHVEVIKSITKDETVELVGKILKTKPTILLYGNEEELKSAVTYELLESFINKNLK